MPRAFYRVPLAAWTETLAAESGGTEIARNTRSVYVLAPSHPAPALDAAGGTCLGTRLSELGATADQFTVARVRRLDGDELVEIAVPTLQILADDDVLETGLPALVFAGDDPADYQ